MTSEPVSRGRWMRTGPTLAVVLAGAGLGWWMFGVRGAAMFAAAGGVIVAGFLLAGARVPGVAAALALVLAAAALHAASTRGWGGADAPGRTRYKASPVGLSHVLTPHQLESRTEDCGWHAASGYPAPCTIARGGEAAFRRLRAVYPLVLLAALLAAAGAAMSLRPAWRLRAPQRLAAAAAALAALLSVGLFAGSAARALAPLAGLPFGVGGTLGTMQLSLALLLCLATCLAPPPRPVAAAGS